MVSDQDRRDLYEALERGLGEGPAATMMELLPPVGWADVARRSDLLALKGEMAELRAELKGEMAEVRGEIAQLRGEIKAQVPRLYGANVASMIGVAGLVIAAARFL
ncbi:MAG TPA: hypothetical protein VHF27_02370 [Acidimicrobiales bacterium]|nr:hypothetical protein [Acidimicrobiales bacterium]